MLGANISYILMNWNDIFRPEAQLCQACCVVLVNFKIGMGWTAGNIDNFAHLGGLVSGLLMGLAFVVSSSTFTHPRLAGNEVMFIQAGLVLSLIWYATLMCVTFLDKSLE